MRPETICRRRPAGPACGLTSILVDCILFLGCGVNQLADEVGLELSKAHDRESGVVTAGVECNAVCDTVGPHGLLRFLLILFLLLLRRAGPHARRQTYLRRVGRSQPNGKNKYSTRREWPRPVEARSSFSWLWRAASSARRWPSRLHKLPSCLQQECAAAQV